MTFLYMKIIYYSLDRLVKTVWLLCKIKHMLLIDQIIIAFEIYLKQSIQQLIIGSMAKS